MRCDTSPNYKGNAQFAFVLHILLKTFLVQSDIYSKNIQLLNERNEQYIIFYKM